MTFNLNTFNFKTFRLTTYDFQTILKRLGNPVLQASCKNRSCSRSCVSIKKLLCPVCHCWLTNRWEGCTRVDKPENLSLFKKKH